jgi:hypothetical protein
MSNFIVSNPEYFFATIKLINICIFAVLLRMSLGFCGQTWCKTFAHSLSFLLLPIITFSVTSVISNNLALSLGLVGALSIVRFRNPVKSPFELTVYFLCISIGICSAVSWKWPILLGGVSLLLICIAGTLNIFFNRYFNKNAFQTSFSEGNSLNTLEVTSLKKIHSIKKSSLLISYSESHDRCSYRLASQNKNLLLELSEHISSNEATLSVSFSIS